MQKTLTGIRMSAYALAVCVMVYAGVTQAHSTGYFFEQEIDEYRADVGYDPETFTAGQRILLDIDLYEKGADGERVPFDSAWVRVTEGRMTYLATGVAHAKSGPTTVLLVLPEQIKEQVEVHVRYEKNEKPLAEVSFPMPVTHEREAMALMPYLAFMLGAVVVGIGSFVWQRRMGAKR
ncbi:MAG: hypothetical protein KBE09_03210 [Candidatus Pacebacteria bacterium]|nr:hypothetical protein [Candidatus Paceibacterota bacterium]